MNVAKLAGFSIRLDPWAADYGASLMSSAETEAFLLDKIRIDASVERNELEWSALDCSSSVVDSSRTIAFVDGVRRLECNLVFETPSGFLYGAFGSCAAGGVVLKPGQMNVTSDAFTVTSVKRYLFAPIELDLPDSFELPVQYPRGAAISVIVQKIAGFDPAQPLAELQRLMRHEEAAVTDTLHGSGEAEIVIADGPLNVVLMKERLAGFIKSLHSLYLSPALFPVMSALQKCERTPMFLIEAIEPDSHVLNRYASYIRISEPGPQQSTLAGIARLEVSGEMDVEKAADLMNSCCCCVPKYASQFGRDPRAPQNLIPLSFVETELRRMMGNPEIIRRLFIDWLRERENLEV